MSEMSESQIRKCPNFCLALITNKLLVLINLKEVKIYEVTCLNRALDTFRTLTSLYPFHYRERVFKILDL